MKTLTYCITRRGFVAFATAVVFAATAGRWPCRAESGEFVLVRDGKPVATIVTATGATDPATFGAQELQLHVWPVP